MRAYLLRRCSFALVAMGAVCLSLALSSAAGATSTGSLSFVTDSSWTVNGSPASIIDPWCYAGYGAWTTALGYNWISVGTCVAPPPETDTYEKTFDVPGTPTAASIGIAADNEVSLSVNGTNVLTQSDGYVNFHSVANVDITPYLHSGSNTIDAVVTNTGTGRSVSGVVAQVSVTYDLPDTTPPSIAPTPDQTAEAQSADGAVVNYSTPSATDDVDGTDAVTCDPASGSTFPLGTTQVNCSATDAAGNPASSSFNVIVQDTTQPAIAFAGQSPAANSAGWNNGAVTLTWNCTDAVSGAWQVTQTLSEEGANQSATGTCTDGTGNSSSDTEGGVNIDETAPAVTYTGGGTYTVDQNVTITCSSSDALSLVASDTCTGVSAPAWSLGLGSHDLSATATDNAGNQGSGSTSYTVKVDAGSLCALVTRWAKNAGEANSLCVKLKAGAAAKARGQAKTAQSTIDAFDNEVRAQSGKSFTAAQATLLVQFAAAL